MTPLNQRFDDLRDAERVATDDLDALWAELEPVTVEEILGTWRGGDFSTGHVASRVLEKVHSGIMNGKLEVAFGVSDLYYFWLERDDR